MAAIIKIEEVNKIYQTGGLKVHALREVNLVIEEGEMVAVMGPSGSGKSTLMNIVGCLDRPTSGQYLLSGLPVAERRDDELAEMRNEFLGFIFQEFNLLGSMTALDNVMLPLTYRRMPEEKRRERALRALKQVGLSDRLDHRPNQLSGGEKQRVAMARGLAQEPSLLVADEPTGNLDSSTQREIMELLVQLNREAGITVLVVTHDEAVAAHCERVVYLYDGRVVGDQSVEEADLSPSPGGGVRR